MSRKTGRTLFCCMLLSSSVLTDAYGLSQQGGKANNKGASQVSTAKKTVIGETSAMNNNKMIENSSSMNKQPPKKVDLFGTSKPPKKVDVYGTSKSQKTGNVFGASKTEQKLILEINELKRMHQQLIEEKTKDPNNGKKVRLLQHIEKQIQIREMQLDKKQKQNRHVSDHYKRVTKARKVQQLFNPKQFLTAAPLNIGQSKSALQSLGQQNLAQPYVQNSITQQKLEPHRSQMKSHVPFKTEANNYLLQHSDQHGNFVSANQIVLPQGPRNAVYPQNVVRREPLTVNTHQLNRVVAQHIPQQHILVPVSALSSGNILNSHGLLSNKLVIVKPVLNDKRLTAGSNGGKSSLAPTPTKQTPKPLPKTTKSTTTMTTTTEAPTTTVPMTTPTTTSKPETTTTMDIETVKQNLLKTSVRKQELEIRKLQLEIRALQREERNNLPEMENEDGPQPRRGSRRRLFPFIR